MTTTNSDAMQEKMSKFDQFIEGLYEFYFDNRKGQYLIYGLTFLVSVAHALVGILLLGKDERSVVFDCVILAVIFLIGLPVAYSLGAIYADTNARSKPSDNRSAATAVPSRSH